MNYHFDVINDKIKGRPDLKLYTGNVKSYSFDFEFDEHWNSLIKFATFNSGTNTYVIELSDNSIIVPHEILTCPGICTFGVYGTSADDDIKRISTNIIEFEIIKGAYSDGLTPSVPTPDIWENLFKNSIPKIIDGYWYLYDPKNSIYVNTGINSVGQFPVKGVDYFTDEDKNVFVEEVSERAIGDIEKALDEIIAIQNELIGGDAV